MHHVENIHTIEISSPRITNLEGAGVVRIEERNNVGRINGVCVLVLGHLSIQIHKAQCGALLNAQVKKLQNSE